MCHTHTHAHMYIYIYMCVCVCVCVCMCDTKMQGCIISSLTVYIYIYIYIYTKRVISWIYILYDCARLHIDIQVLASQQRLIVNCSMRTLDAGERNYKERWKIGMNDERDSMDSMLSAWLYDNNDDNDDDAGFFKFPKVSVWQKLDNSKFPLSCQFCNNCRHGSSDKRRILLRRVSLDKCLIAYVSQGFENNLHPSNPSSTQTKKLDQHLQKEHLVCTHENQAVMFFRDRCQFNFVGFCCKPHDRKVKN